MLFRTVSIVPEYNDNFARQNYHHHPIDETVHAGVGETGDGGVQ